VDAKHNTYYAADGSDLRYATEEEIEKYRLAASHKRRKPDSPRDKNESAVTVPDVRGDTRARKTDEERRGGHSSRDINANRRLRDQASKSDKERESSRVSRGGRDDYVRDKFEIRVIQIPHGKVPQKDASRVILQNAIGRVEMIQTTSTKTNAIAVR